MLMNVRGHLFPAVAVCFLAVAACGGEEVHSPQMPTEESAAPAAAEPVADKAAVPSSEGAATKSEAAQASPTAVKPPIAPKAPALPAGKAEKVEAPPFEGTKITIFHTANLIGELEPCG